MPRCLSWQTCGAFPAPMCTVHASTKPARRHYIKRGHLGIYITTARPSIERRRGSSSPLTAGSVPLIAQQIAARRAPGRAVAGSFRATLRRPRPPPPHSTPAACECVGAHVRACVEVFGGTTRTTQSQNGAIARHDAAGVRKRSGASTLSVLSHGSANAQAEARSRPALCLSLDVTDVSHVAHG